MDTQPQKLCKILLIGDSCLDRFHYGSCTRLSPEAPIPILVHKTTKEVGGMVINVKNNLEAFGSKVKVDCLTNSEEIIKERFIDEASGQHILRFDSGEKKKVSPVNLLSEKIKNISRYDLLIISDYDKGFVTPTAAKRLCEICATHGIPIFVDTKKKEITCYEGSIVKVNEKEQSNFKKPFPKHQLIITRGAHGATWNGRNYPTRTEQVADVSGAGDTFLAVLSYKYIRNKKDIDSAIKCANIAASYVVSKSGTYALKERDIEKLCL